MFVNTTNVDAHDECWIKINNNNKLDIIIQSKIERWKKINLDVC